MWVAIALLIGLGLIIDTRGRVGRLDYRLRLLEEAVRTRLRNTPGDALFVPVREVEPVLEPEPEPELVPEPEPEPEPEPVMAFAEPPATVFAPVVVEEVEEPEVEPEPEDMAEPEPVAAFATVQDAPKPQPIPYVPPVYEEYAPAEEIPARKSFSINFEDLFGRRLPIWAGGITLAIAGVLIVKYAIDAGFFGHMTPTIRVILGALFGFGLIGGAEVAYRKEATVRDPRVRQALSGAGLATLYASVLVASNVYHLIAPLTAFFAMAAVTAGALALSVRFGAPSALLGLAGGLSAPALVSSLQPDVPMLSVYLALTIAALATVSRMQRWAWLGVIALLGGAGWSAWLIATGALGALESLSIGGLVILLSVALPFVAFTGESGAFRRMASILIGSAELAALVAKGGFEPLQWGLFALIAAAGQWLSWREKGFEIVPSISLGVTALLMVVWPVPVPYWFTVIGVAMAIIHGVPLLVRLWQVPVRFQTALELAALSLAILLLPMRHYYLFDHSRDGLFALLAGMGALVAAIGAGSGWKREERIADARFALLVTTSALLSAGMILFLTASWFAPLAFAIVAGAVLMLGERARDPRIETIASGFAAATLPLLAVTGGYATELLRLIGLSDGPVDAHALLRWGGTCALFVLFGIRATGTVLRNGAQAMAAVLGYGLLAQILPGWALPLGLAAVAGATLLIARRAMQPGMSGFANTLALVTVPLLAITGADSLNEWLRLVGMGDGPVLPLALFRRGGVATMFALFAWRGGKGFAFVASAATGFMAYGTIAQAIPGWALPLDLAAVAGAILWISTRREEGLFEPLAAIFAFASVPLLVISESYPYDEGVRLLGIGGGTDVVQAVLRWGAVTALFASFAWQAKSAPLRLIAHFGAAVMAYGTVAQMIPGWALPLDLAGVAIALLLVGGREGDPKIEIMAALSSLVAVPLLMTTGDGPYLEWLRLLGENGAPIMLEPILRWAGVAGLASVFAWRAQLAPVRVVAQLAAAFFGCGLVAQIVPGTLLPIVPAAGLALLSFAVKTHGLNRFIPAAGVLTALVAAWAAGPVAMWSNGALLSLTGQPMMIDGDTAVLLTQIIIPALLLIFALWNARGQLPQGLRIAGAATVSLLGLVGVHSLYRLGFAVGFGDKFVQIGLGERLLWAGLLLAAGWGFGRGAARGGVRFGVSVSLISAAVLHTLYYSLILHNPIWVEQAVGPFPVANLLIPLFALVPLGLWQLGRMLPELQAKAARGLQLGVMALVCLFAFATLRQGFVQSILTVPGLSAGEDIFRSILAIALAVGFLLWGIRSQQRDWRIASLVLMLGAVAKVFLLDAKGLEGLMRIGSFVALGFSLIGIGWLYSRQLGAATPPPESSD